MIILDFQVDENNLERDFTADLVDENLSVLQETYFVFPVRFRINESEMFEVTRKRSVLYGGQTGSNFTREDCLFDDLWLPLPLLHFALVGYEKVNKACERMEVSYPLPAVGSKLVFIPVGDKLEVHSTINSKVEYVECEEILESFMNFKHKVFRFINNRVPQLDKNSRWLAMLDTAE